VNKTERVGNNIWYRGTLNNRQVFIHESYLIDNRMVYEDFNVTLNEALNRQMNQLQQTDKYRNSPAFVHQNYVTSNRTTANVNVRAAADTSSHVYGLLERGSIVNILSSQNNFYQISYQAWRNPTRQDVQQYLDPSNNDIFQHLSLSDSVGVNASSLNNILTGKGILSGKGQAFIDGGKQHQVNEVYLISHALLETGNGSSALAKGVEVGTNSSGNPVLATSSNRSSLNNIQTVYNMFGIGAFDGDAHRAGAVRAYREGWNTPEKAIIGGAKFIGSSYIHNSYNQDTLYKMRWNPANPGYPQYATDIGWATKQVGNIQNMYAQLDNPVLRFKIPRYK
ncbi:N-acetylglucosaminidase, partial [Oceanobacillus sojae]|uniref:N-acetylglucosaminidase n=1 Tax=Oceanobacillus sojae TaxID=582851 RepID=UPI0011BDA2F9